MSDDSARMGEVGRTRSKGLGKHAKGAVIDERPKYPATLHHASEHLPEHQRFLARRPGGKFRGPAHGFHTVSCSCSTHPCRCGTEKAREYVVHKKHLHT